jgi:hypothetical protein
MAVLAGRLTSSDARSVDGIVGVVAALLGLAAALPIVTREIPPLADYPNHLARLYAIGHLDHDALLARYYRIEWHALPNLALDLIVPPLAALVGLYRAGQLFLLLAMALIVTGCRGVSRSLHGGSSPGWLGAFLLLYSYPLLSGVVNYYLGLGVALWALAAWITLRRRPAPLRAGVSTLFVPALFFCHLFVLGLYGLAVVSYEAALAVRRREWPKPADVLALMLPFLPALALLALSPTTERLGELRWDLATKATGLAQLAVQFHPRVDLAIAAAVAALLLLAWRRGVLRLDRAAWGLLGLATALFIALPAGIFGSWGADVRLPIGVAILLVGFLEWRLPSPGQTAAFIAIVAVLSLLRIGLVETTWRSFDATISAMRAAFATMPPGGRLLVALADRGEPHFALRKLTQAPLLAMIERSSFVPIAYTHPAMQILRVRPEMWDLSTRGTNDDRPPKLGELLAVLRDPALAPANGPYYARWPDNFDALIVVYAAPEASNPLPARLTPLAAGPRFQLYAIRR